MEENNQTLEERVASFVRDDRDISLMYQGDYTHISDKKSIYVQTMKQGQYGIVEDCQESIFRGICEDFELNTKELRYMITNYK